MSTREYREQYNREHKAEIAKRNHAYYTKQKALHADDQYVVIADGRSLRLDYDPEGLYRPGATFLKSEIPGVRKNNNHCLDRECFAKGTLFTDTCTGKQYRYNGKKLEVVNG
jgi:hypothetical protein